MEDDGLPCYSNISPWMEGECEECYKGEKQKRYLKFIKTTLFIFNRKKDILPIEIKNLEGLSVDKIES